MSSAALLRWRTDRAELLDQLFDVHQVVTRGVGFDTRTPTGELNRALLLRMAAQFQGFARDLHLEASVAFGALAQPSDPAIAEVIASSLQSNRWLDRGNVHEGTLANDFGRFGLDLWSELGARDARTSARRAHLMWFNVARNGLAHDDHDRIAKFEAAGYRIDLAWLRRFRGALDGLAGTIDDVLSIHLARLFKTGRPW